jgi:putative ABC transport system permease protein
MQSTLNTIYHLEQSTGVVPFALYEAALTDPRVEQVYPVYVGDSYQGIRVIGTSAAFLRFGEPVKGRSFTFSEGGPFQGLYQVVLGSEAARRTGLSLQDTLVIAHGLTEPDPSAEVLEHDQLPVIVVGILAPTGTAHDRVMFTSFKTTAALHQPTHLHGATDPAEILVTQLDAVLIRFKNPQAALQVAGVINYPTPDNPFMRMQMARDPYFAFKTEIMAVIPAQQISNLLSIVGNAERVLSWVSRFVVIIALLSVLIGLYNTMEGRRRDLAIFRTLGARRSTLLAVMILESAAIVAIGSLLGYVGSHALVAVIAPMLLESAGVVIQPWQHDSSSVSVILALMSAGVLIGTVPGIKAYRNDPVRNLASL